MNENDFITIRFKPYHRKCGDETYEEGSSFNKDDISATSFEVEDHKVKHIFGGEEFRYTLRKSQIELIDNDGGRTIYIQFNDGADVAFSINYPDYMIIQMQLLGHLKIYDFLVDDYESKLYAEYSEEAKRIMGLK